MLRAGRRKVVERLQRSCDDPEGAQRVRLAALLGELTDTAFGREHGLSRVRTLDDLRAAVPIRTHGELLPWLDRVAAGEGRVLTRSPVRMLLETSGTTGVPKHLPVTDPWAATVADAQALWMLGMVREHEGATRGRALTMVSPAEHARSPGGLPIGSNTGRMLERQPWYVRLRYPVPGSVFELKPSDLKLYAALRFAIPAPVTTITTANPSTLLLMARRLLQWREPLSRDLADGTLRHGPAAGFDRGTRRRLELRLRRHRPPTGPWTPASLWPLQVVSCWTGGPAAYFAARLPDALGGPIPVHPVGVTASEGYFAVPLSGDWPGGVVHLDGHLLEFVDDAGLARGAHQLEQGERLRLVVTTEAGLVRYDLRDVVEVVGRCGRAPLIRFVGKAGRYLNAVGERVTEDQVSAAARDAAEHTGLFPVGLTAALRWADVPDYRLLVEGLAPEAAERFATAWDRALQAHNVEYEGKRGSDRLGPPVAEPLPAGAYLCYRQARVAAGAPDGQVKDPVVAVDDAELQRILDAATQAGAR
ncbi:MAG: GH3 auxin-responsive promoter family protein [Alphaproteobacteria bacterium]|nr:GH3 auxin-responsive promoter family protein [Alphaproteobacteria bacterium]